MKVALAQIGSGTDITDNLAQIIDAATAAHHEGAEVVLFPEYAMYEKRVVDGTFADMAEPLDGPFGSAVADLAARLGVAVVAGLVEVNPDDPTRPFNTLAAWSASGALVGRHRKALLYDAGVFSESSYISAGDLTDPSTVRIGDTVFGLQTCYELRFPEISRRQARAGATVLAVLSSWVPGPGKIVQWSTLAGARAIENICHVAAVTQSAPVSTGHSLAVGPDGAVLACLADAPAQVTVTIDASVTERQRQADLRALSVDV
ncbi:MULTISPECIES: nitrilase-related carbon-nitrogen hydrolase [unclassified Mycolicibacterium]|uniref:nitrilase-related carbon-nitrogen hydrolase n=1 Tax=unclassified Mycolicibacterium TaxID=2636767 RepID=UPI0013910D8E|nr:MULTISPECIES: nitrilase-related carbon-nitrogen hydrolase [unclassified Mycolicibacterium]